MFVPILLLLQGNAIWCHAMLVTEQRWYQRVVMALSVSLGCSYYRVIYQCQVQWGIMGHKRRKQMKRLHWFAFYNIPSPEPLVFATWNRRVTSETNGAVGLSRGTLGGSVCCAAAVFQVRQVIISLEIFLWGEKPLKTKQDKPIQILVTANV